MLGATFTTTKRNVMKKNMKETSMDDNGTRTQILLGRLEVKMDMNAQNFEKLQGKIDKVGEEVNSLKNDVTEIRAKQPTRLPWPTIVIGIAGFGGIISATVLVINLVSGNN